MDPNYMPRLFVLKIQIVTERTRVPLFRSTTCTTHFIRLTKSVRLGSCRQAVHNDNHGRQEKSVQSQEHERSEKRTWKGIPLYLISSHLLHISIWAVDQSFNSSYSPHVSLPLIVRKFHALWTAATRMATGRRIILFKSSVQEYSNLNISLRLTRNEVVGGTGGWWSSL